MSTTFLDPAPAGRWRNQVLAWTRTPRLRLIALVAIVILAAAVRFANLAALGYANHYYTAGVVSMLQSWQNFFFVAAEPGGAVSIDKPPVGLWLQTISAAVFGVNGFGVLLPQLLAGVAAVVVLYHLVRRSFGTTAGLLAALALAITPIVVATDRNNTPDSTLILTLLLAAWAFIAATERGKLRYLLLGVALVGIGFNIKMLQAYLPLPAFYALYFLGAKAGLSRKLLNLSLATGLLLTVSLAWAVVVDLTPADQRPYVGSSGNNSVINLMLGYNGIERLTGMGGRGGLLGGLLDNSNQDGPAAAPQQDGRDGATGADGTTSRTQPGADGGLRPPGADGGFPGRGPGTGGPGAGPGGAGGGFMKTGEAGALRLFTTPLSKEVSWLLPFGLFSIGLLAFRTRLRWPLAPQHQAVVLWGGWLLTGGTFFSIAGFFHQYYLSILAAPLVALVAGGAVVLWRIRAERPWLATGLLLLAAGATLLLQLMTAQEYVGFAWWLAIAGLLFLIGAGLLVVAAYRYRHQLALAGFATIIAALLVIPGVWSVLTTLNASGNQSLPSAYSGAASGPANRGDVQVNQELLSYLEANTQGVQYLMAVPSAMQGADYILATGRPVLYLGGFMGQDEVVTSAELAQMVADGELRYIYWNGSGRGGPGGMGDSQSDISAWVTSTCTAVEGFETNTSNMGTPDGTAAPAGATNNATQTDGRDGRDGAGGPGGMGGMEVTLYDCVGA